MQLDNRTRAALGYGENARILPICTATHLKLKLLDVNLELLDVILELSDAHLASFTHHSLRRLYFLDISEIPLVNGHPGTILSGFLKKYLRNGVRRSVFTTGGKKHHN